MDSGEMLRATLGDCGVVDEGRLYDPEGMISTEPDNTEYSYQKRVVERDLQFCDQDDRGVEGRVCLKGPMIFTGSGKFSASYRIFLK
jgi:hypothetical protein